MNQSEQIDALADALSKAQAHIVGAKKDSKNPFFKSDYADLESVWGAIRQPFSACGLAVTQTLDILPDHGVILVTTLMHASGQWIRSIYPVNPIKNDPQGLGACITYARRYALAAIAGVFQTDDDGEVAMGRDVNSRPTPAGGVTQGIFPQQPGPEDGFEPSDGIWRFPGGKHVKKKISELTGREHSEYIVKTEAFFGKQNKPMPEWWGSYLLAAEPVIAEYDKDPFSNP